MKQQMGMGVLKVGAALAIVLLFVIIHLLAYSFLYFSTYIFCLEVELISNKIDSLCIKTLVDRHHDTYRHQG